VAELNIKVVAEREVLDIVQYEKMVRKHKGIAVTVLS